MPDRPSLTSVEARIDAAANRLLATAPATGVRARWVEFLVFVVKQAWACVFGAVFLVVVLAAKLWYPDDAALARNDALTIAAVLIQVVMVWGRLETLRELRVVASGGRVEVVVVVPADDRVGRARGVGLPTAPARCGRDRRVGRERRGRTTLIAHLSRTDNEIADP